MTEVHNSDYWSIQHKVIVRDPDGWDRTNYTESWNEEITEEEFLSRLWGSTIQILPGSKVGNE